jgi:hypothetical protein
MQPAVNEIHVSHCQVYQSRSAISDQSHCYLGGAGGYIMSPKLCCGSPSVDTKHITDPGALCGIVLLVRTQRFFFRTSSESDCPTFLFISFWFATGRHSWEDGKVTYNQQWIMQWKVEWMARSRQLGCLTDANGLHMTFFDHSLLD